MNFFINMLRPLYLLIMILGLVSDIQGQSSIVKLEESPVVRQLNDYFIQYNLRRNDFPGWRIQVYASTDRKEMESALTNFRGRFPGYYAKWTLNDPYYQVRAGTFIDYAEAMRSLQEIRRTFRSATLITDRIRREEVMNL